jgi:ankyrin repeat protein
MKLFTTAGMDLNYVYCDSETNICETLLERYVDERNTPVVSMLLRSGADPNFTHNTYGITLLMIAVGNNDRDMSFLLCESGADLQAKDAEGTGVKFYAKKNPDLYVSLERQFGRR